MVNKTTIDRERFFTHLSKIYRFWVDNDELKQVDSMVVVAGANNLATYFKVDFTTGVYFLASNRKAQFLKPIETTEANDGMPPVKILLREKDDKDQANFKQLINEMKSAGRVIGHFKKDKFESEFVTEWNKALTAAGLAKPIDISHAFALLLAVKDDAEILSIQRAAAATTKVYNAFLRSQIVKAIDQEKKIKHSRLAEDTEKAMSDVTVLGRINKTIVEACYTPIIQSGGNYSLKLSAVSDAKHLHYGAIVSSLGVRYQSYCSNLARTIMVDPAKEVINDYESLLVVETAVINALKPGAKLCDAYKAGVDALRESNPDMIDKLTKNNFGFATGLEFREGALLIGPKNEEIIEAGMVFVVFIGLNDIDNPASSDEQGKKVSLLLSDTVLVQKDGVDILTKDAKSRLKSNIVRFKETNDAESSNKENRDGHRGDNDIQGRGKRSVVLQDQTRNKTTNEDKRKMKQKELAASLNQAARDRLAEQTGSKQEKSYSPIVNRSLNASKLCPGSALKPITDWVERRVNELEMRHVRDDDGNYVYKNETEFREYLQKKNRNWQVYKRVQAMPTSAIPDNVHAIPREILIHMPDDIRRELMHFYNLKTAKEDEAKRRVPIGGGKVSKKFSSKRIVSAKSSSVKSAKISDYFR